jgi:hypothetical protein
VRLPHIAPGTLTALKWLAVVLMIVDHVDWLLFGEQLGFHATAGRLVFPLFGFVFAVNLGRPFAFQRGVYRRSVMRLTLLGLAALPAYVMLAGALPLNIMFTLALVALLAWLVEAGRWTTALFAFVAVGAFVDYQWFGVALCLSLWAAYRYDARWLIGAGFFLGSLEVINGNWWALAVVPVLLIAERVRVDLPRHQAAFYAIYPLHLVALALITLTV